MRILSAVVAIVTGLIVLLGTFLGSQIPVLDQLRLWLINWAVIIAGVAVLIGVLNLVFVQMEKLRSRQKGGMYGAILVFSMIATLLFGGVVGLDNPVMKFTVDAVIVPVEASLLAILAVTLVYASIRLLRRRTDMMSVIFIVTVVLFLIAIMPTPIGQIPVLSPFILDVAGMISRGGARGLLIGVALGTLFTGLRILFGIDRPYGGN